MANSPVFAVELDLTIVRASDGASTVTVVPGTPSATVNYEIRGLLSSSTDNEGLAFWSADLQFDDDADISNHTAGSPPAGMAKFVRTDGFTNPAGYGGTVVSGNLVQIGGGQNAIGNTTGNAPYPVALTADFGVAHSTQVLATGTYTVPANAGPGETHVLKLTACLASVIDEDDIDSPYGTHAVKADCATAVLSIGTPPEAAVTDAFSRKANTSGPGGYCDQDLVPSVKSEPHHTRITEVHITFDTAPGNPAGSGTGVSIEQKTCAAPTYAGYSGSSTWTETVSGNTLILAFNPALDNARTYKLNVGPLITATGGQYIEVRGLIADVNSDGGVNATDRSIVVGVWNGGGGFTCPTDINSDGATNATDRSHVVAQWISSENCAP